MSFTFEKYLKSNNLSQNTQKVYLYTVKQYQSKYLVVSEKNLQSYKTFLIDNYKIKNALNSLFKLKEFTSLQGMELSFIDNLTKNLLMVIKYKINPTKAPKIKNKRISPLLKTNII